MIVMKFGGSSVESAAAIERVASIVGARRERRPVVVVSAMGKTTNKLLAIAQTALDGTREEYLRQIHDLRDFHSREARLVVPLEERSELDRTLDEHFQELTELVKGLAVLGESLDQFRQLLEVLIQRAIELGTLLQRHYQTRLARVEIAQVVDLAQIFLPCSVERGL